MLAWIAGFTAQAEALNGKWPVIYTTEDLVAGVHGVRGPVPA